MTSRSIMESVEKRSWKQASYKCFRLAAMPLLSITEVQAAEWHFIGELNRLKGCGLSSLSFRN